MSWFSGTDLVQSLISHLNYFSKHLLHLPFYSLSPPPCCQSAVSKYKSVFLSSIVRVVCFLRIMIYKSVHYPSLAHLPSFLLHYTTHTHPPIHNYLCFTCNSPSVPCYFMSPCFRTFWSLPSIPLSTSQILVLQDRFQVSPILLSLFWTPGKSGLRIPIMPYVPLSLSLIYIYIYIYTYICAHTHTSI